MSDIRLIMDLDERIEMFLGKEPEMDESVYVADSSCVIGDVRIGKDSSVWPMVVLRGDINYIKVGESTNLQDGTIVHLSDDCPVEIGDYVTVGHGAMIHGCKIEDECLIGMRATILDGAVIGRNSIIGAGALVPKNMEVPPGSLVLGLPGKVVKTLSQEEQEGIRYWAEKYVRLAQAHRKRFT